MRNIVLLATLTFVAAVAIACSGDDGASAPTPSLVEMVSTPTPSESAPPRTPTVYPSPLPVPDDWLEHVDDGGLFSFRYPQIWTLNSERPGYAALYSYDPDEIAPGPPSLPPEAVKVEVSGRETAGSGGCGASMKFDLSTDELVVDPGAAEWTLGGMPAWLWVYGPGEGEGGTTLIPSVSVIYKDYCFSLAGYYTQAVPDVVTFLQIVESFEFHF